MLTYTIAIFCYLHGAGVLGVFSKFPECSGILLLTLFEQLSVSALMSDLDFPVV